MSIKPPSDQWVTSYRIIKDKKPSENYWLTLSPFKVIERNYGISIFL